VNDVEDDVTKVVPTLWLEVVILVVVLGRAAVPVVDVAVRFVVGTVVVLKVTVTNDVACVVDVTGIDVTWA
jgi:hypothetical protein